MSTQDDALPEPVAWIDSTGHPHHISTMQTATHRRLYGEMKPLYTADQMHAAIARERAKRNKCNKSSL